MKILNELGRRISPVEYWHDDFEELLEEVLKPTKLSYAEFVARGYLKGPDQFRLYETKGFRTPTGKVELKLSTGEKLKLKPLPEFTSLPEAYDPDFPLILISAKSRYYLLSSYRWVARLREKRPHPLVEIHPETAAAYEISDGDRVVVATRYGEITQIAHVTDIVHPRVVSAALGCGFRKEQRGAIRMAQVEFNMLTSMARRGKNSEHPT